MQGDAYQARITGNGGAEVKLDGANLLARWSRELESGSIFKVQAYYDHTNRNDPTSFIDRVDTFDVEAQHDLPAWRSHRISYGAGYRYALDDTTPTAIVRFIPEDRRLHWGTVFAQDQWDFAPDFTLTVGGKVQTTEYVPAEFMPDVRLDWKPSPSQLIWLAGSRVARTPGRIDRDFNLPGTPPFFIKGNTTFKSETGRVGEVGYRAQPMASFSYSVVGFVARLDNLRGGAAAPGGGSMVANVVEGTTSGIEAWAIWQATEQWRLTAGLLELRQDLRAKDGSGDTSGPANLGNDPRHSLKLRSAYRVTPDIDFDVAWRYVSALSYLRTVPSYQATDIRVAWRVRKDIELALVGNNLFDSGHVEFDEHGQPAVIPRAAYVQVRMQF
jgi:iron complex outermembrane receptor protein